MTTTALAAVLALGLTAVSPSAGQAEPGGQKSGAGWDPARKGQMMLDRFDTNKDGTIALEEFTAVYDARFEAADTNSKGQITLEQWLESRPGQGYRTDRAEARFNRLDTNNDGVLSKDEVRSSAERKFTRMDSDGDGVITQDELAQMRGPGGRGQGTGPGGGQGMGSGSGQGTGPGGGQNR
jgi:Ca2+-binding EF-hand superfamily protein